MSWCHRTYINCNPYYIIDFRNKISKDPSFLGFDKVEEWGIEPYGTCEINEDNIYINVNSHAPVSEFIHAFSDYYYKAKIEIEFYPGDMGANICYETIINNNVIECRYEERDWVKEEMQDNMIESCVESVYDIVKNNGLNDMQSELREFFFKLLYRDEWLEREKRHAEKEAKRAARFSNDDDEESPF